ncbi:hypothetical protein O3M35_009002 [Rhynocoris fuscipes]|uniref:ZAD domain-containing protein n=1 Tax=Rhynocoris fuscipes TaxID=488301 RepID=A0AAW1D7D2_9HEMI
MSDIDVPVKCFCRLCAKYELCTNIYSSIGMRQLLAVKITTCLPIQIDKNDKLTKGVCPGCVVKLNSAYELITTCVKVQSKLEEALNNGYQDGLEEVSSSVVKPMSVNFSSDESPPADSVMVLPLSVDNLAEFNRLNDGNGEKVVEDCSPPLAVIASVRTLASGPPNKIHTANTAAPGELEHRAKKERKTVCRFCKQWYPRSKIKDHEAAHCVVDPQQT